MKATQIEFRLRVFIFVVIIAVGFWSPWIEYIGSTNGFARRLPLMEWLALEISRLGLFSFTVATPVVIVLGSLIAALGAILRIWGASYLGPATVHSAEMKAGMVMAAGPYRYVRNPLYLGSWLSMAAMTFIMPPTGALFLMLLLSLFLVRLVLGEEAFLTAQLGDPYRAYLKAVPRWFPRVRSGLPTSSAMPKWARGALSELNPIGVFVTLAAFSWSYNHWLMTQAILVSFGLSIVVRALMPSVSSSL
jgi:protein-S-isoprenylcysteine O-methyltransferase Ste14